MNIVYVSIENIKWTSLGEISNFLSRPRHSDHTCLRFKLSVSGRSIIGRKNTCWTVKYSSYMNNLLLVELSPLWLSYHTQTLPMVPTYYWQLIACFKTTNYSNHGTNPSLISGILATKQTFPLIRILEHWLPRNRNSNDTNMLKTLKL